MNRDVLTTLESLSPATSVETAWPSSAREAALERILTAAAESPPVTRRRRAIIATVLTAVLIPVAVGAAAAGGVLPQSFTQHLSFWRSQGGVDPGTARRVVQVPGPDGEVLSVWAATGPDGTTCVSPLFEAPGELTRPAPADVDLTGGTCQPMNAPHDPFGDVSGGANDRGIHVMYGAAGEAVRAELRLTDGTVRPAASAEGMFFFWYLADRRVDSPVLVGYTADGRVLKKRLPNLIAQTHLGG